MYNESHLATPPGKTTAHTTDYTVLIDTILAAIASQSTRA